VGIGDDARIAVNFSMMTEGSSYTREKLIDFVLDKVILIS
jgi:hypothetical protein